MLVLLLFVINLLVVNANECGRRPASSNRMAGGSQVQQVDKWPWTVFLITNSYCGGSLVGPRWVLTAAHCVQEHLQPKDITVVINMLEVDAQALRGQVLSGNYGGRRPGYRGRGRRSAGSLQASSSKVFRIFRVFSGAQSLSKTGMHLADDLALLQLERPLNGISVCLPANDGPLLNPALTSFLVGYGQLHKNDHSYKRRRLEGRTNIAPYDRCTHENRLMGIKKSDNFICTVTGSDACPGDSGSPLVVQSPIDGRFYQTGVVSAGTKCAVNTIEVFARVSQYCQTIAEWTRGEVTCQ